VHLFSCADDRIDRASLYAQGASYARGFVDHGDGTFALCPMDWVEGYDRFAQCCCQTRDTLRTTGRALVVTRLAAGHGFSIGTAGGIAAFRALRLR
jgi:hypothetical protein